MNTTKAQKMAALLDSCEGCGEAARLLQCAVERLFADDVPPAELAPALAALDAAIAALEALDEATR